jgi:hypothetical protein
MLENRDDGSDPTTWLEPVSGEGYHQAHSDQQQARARPTRDRAATSDQGQ